MLKENYAAIIFALILGLVFSLYSAQPKPEISARNAQEEIAEEIVRFHVLANSDSNEDQELKIKVKDTVVEAMKEKLTDTESKSEAVAILENELSFIIETAKNVVEQEGYTYAVEATLDKHYFPVKIYGDMVFPSGTYDALRIEIGEAKGKNWWCVMYPPLCLVDGTYSIVPEESKDKLQHVLTEEDYNSLFAQNKKAKVKIKFKLLDKLLDGVDGDK